jgi:hypothetical protein
MTTIICSQCSCEVHPLAVFPKSLCLSCYELNWERKHANMTPQQIARSLEADIAGVFNQQETK